MLNKKSVTDINVTGKKVTAALLCQGVSAAKAAAGAAFIHGRAAQRLCEKMPPHAVLAGDLIDGLFLR